ncbi:MAG TPA: gliding motility-associated C-terminal domain-containing protein [Crocinitomicaceae bacterium]|nr:gliding motility-associated C-terminal domain-containing protein [Crocinitomicaceae bacterium]
MDKPVFYIVFVLFFAFSLKAQENLVPNGSFEEYNWCPMGVADFSVMNWYSPTWGSPDYFNICNAYPVAFGYKYPQDGNGCVGFGVSFDSLQGVWREYIQVELVNTLKYGKNYYFSCFLSKADSSSVCVTDIGISFSENPIGGQYVHGISYIPQFTNTSETITCDESNWNKMEFVFTASGSEKFLTIGYFNEDSFLDTSIVKFYPIPFAYYYIDNVFLQEIEAEIVIPNVFTPNNDSVNDYYNLLGIPQGTSLTILNRWGNKVFQTDKANTEFWDGKYQGKDCLSGVYFYILDNKNNSFKKTGFIHLVR